MEHWGELFLSILYLSKAFNPLDRSDLLFHHSSSGLVTSRGFKHDRIAECRIYLVLPVEKQPPVHYIFVLAYSPGRLQNTAKSTTSFEKGHLRPLTACAN